MFSLFGKKKGASAVVIDIGSTSIAGAYVRFPADRPVVDYLVRMPIDAPEVGTRPDVYLNRALHTLISTLIEVGLPSFARQGETHPSHVYVSIGPPWQMTSIQTERIAPGKPFVFSESLVTQVLQKRLEMKKGIKVLERKVIATILNGYETPEPNGKRVDRAEIVTLSSVMDEELMALIGKEAKRLLPEQGVLIAPFQSLAYSVLRAQYPYEKEFMLMRVSGEVTSMLFVSRGLVTYATEVPVGLNAVIDMSAKDMRAVPVNGGVSKASPQQKTAPEHDGQAWVEGITQGLTEFTAQHALPRILYLVAPEQAMPALRRLIDTKEVHRLWLSDEPLTVIPVISRLLSSLIQHQGDAQPDVMLDLIVLFAELRLKDKK